MRTLLCTLVTIGWLHLAALPASSQEAADRKAVPDAAAQAQAEKLIRDVFKDEYARTSAADRLNLARKLLQQGIDTVDDPASRFVLFREARDLAAQAGDLETALTAVDEMARFFQVSAPEMKKLNASSTNDGYTPNCPAERPPSAAPKASMTDHVAELMALAAPSSRRLTMSGRIALRAGK